MAGSEIRRAGLDYCLDTLSKNKQTELFGALNQLKEDVHKLRMAETEGDFEITEDDYWQVIGRFEKKENVAMSS